jgi:hypothetical protein
LQTKKPESETDPKGVSEKCGRRRKEAQSFLQNRDLPQSIAESRPMEFGLVHFLRFLAAVPPTGRLPGTKNPVENK